MRSSIVLAPFVFLTTLLSLLSGASAIRLIESKSLNSCQANSSFAASLFNVVFTPDNKTLTFDIVFVSSIRGNVTFGLELSAYGYTFFTQKLDPCTVKGMAGMCPMAAGQLDVNSNLQLDDKTIAQIPGIAYGVPDLDANVKIHINSTANPLVSLACVEANLSNGQTVDQKGVGWTTAVIAGLALVASAVTSGLGHSNTAAHVAANALSLFGYFQAQAIFGMTSVSLPPIVQSWTQNFDWTMGIIGVDFMQNIATWYQKSTGGTPATLLNTLTTNSVQVEKRSIGQFVERSAGGSNRLLARAHELYARSNDAGSNAATGSYIVRGIKRVAFRAGIEGTNIFLIGLAFFCIFIVFTIFFVALFKAICELSVKMKWIKGDKFQDFRNGWTTVLKGIMFRMVLIGYPQMTILCLWEFTQVDSPAEVILAIFFFFGMTGTLAWAAMKVIRIAQRSVEMHKNPAYILYSDPAALNKWGFLYVHFRATAYYFILPNLVYILIKGMFIAFGQGAGTVQAVALLLVEATALIGASVIRPWMDKTTNTFNIAICAVNFINTIFLLVFTEVFNQPGIVTGVMGVIFFIINAAFSLVLLILVFIATVYAFLRKNPDTRYRPMSDDRASFIKSQTALNTELDALGATARGDTKGGYKHNLDLDDDNDSWSTDSARRQANNLPPTSTANPASNFRDFREPPRSPVDPSVPLFPAGAGGPPNYQDRSRNVSPAPGVYRDNSNSNSNLSQNYKVQSNTASPWQRGAGYDH